MASVRGDGRVVRFREAALALRRAVFSAEADAARWSMGVLVALSELHAAGLSLPEVPRGEDDEPAPAPAVEGVYGEVARVVASRLGERRYYRMVYDPTSEEETVTGDLGDDLGDVLADVSRVLRAWDEGDASLAWELWECREISLPVHWGHHAAHAMTALAWLCR